MKEQPKDLLRTWIEIDKKAILHNIGQLRKIIKPETRLMAVIKSNAYGHGLVGFAKTAESKVDWFGVDSITEALELRRKSIKKPIFVLGYTLPIYFSKAHSLNISLTIDNFDSLKKIARLGKRERPKIHLKIDTGMHRQGFLLSDLKNIASVLKSNNIPIEGIYTHFAAAKDYTYPDYSLKQLKAFDEANKILKHSGINNYIKHASATGGTILYSRGHYNLVRIGIGLYGQYPNDLIKIQLSLQYRTKKLALKPALAWKSIVGSTKKVPQGSFVGYDLTEKLNKPSVIAVVPIGYWHGYDRKLSSIGEVLIEGKKAKLLGRVSMDMVVIDITGIKNAKVGSEVVLIGKQKDEEITAQDLAQKAGTTHYEILTRLNPLIKRFYV